MLWLLASSSVPGPSVESLRRSNAWAARQRLYYTPGREADASRLQNMLAKQCVGLYSKAAMHTPVDVTNDACVVANELKADCLVAIGGGSVVGLSKAIALRTDLPQIVIPTTYSGSEVEVSPT